MLPSYNSALIRSHALNMPLNGLLSMLTTSYLCFFLGYYKKDAYITSCKKTDLILAKLSSDIVAQKLFLYNNGTGITPTELPAAPIL